MNASENRNSMASQQPSGTNAAPVLTPRGPRRATWLRLALVLGVVATFLGVGACGRSDRPSKLPTNPTGAFPIPGGDPPSDPGVPGVPAPGHEVVFVGAGDIANSVSGAEATAKVLDRTPGTVFTLGDNAYSDGTLAEYQQKYQPTWGRHRARTRPSPGNHEYNTSGASGYYTYFGQVAGPSKRGYYSFDLGDWHIISLNSNVSMSAGSAQEQWLRADLAANRTRCTLAYWHHPRFSSGEHGSSTASKALWQALQEAGAEVILVGHDHDYERFAPQLADGTLDRSKGIRQFVVGTGGTSLRSVSSPIKNSEVINDDSHGVLKLTLGPGTYSWEFLPVSGDDFRDSGTGTCH